MPARSPICSVNDFVVRFANVNGSGSASANELFARAVLRMGVPVSSRNIFPSNIQGLPTWFEVRICEDGHLGARGGYDLMVAMNPQTWDKDVAGIEPGGYLFYDFDQADAGVEIPRRHRGPRRAADRDLQPRIYRSAPAPAVQEHHLSRRAVGAARHRAGRDRGAVLRAVQGQGKADRRQQARAASRPRLGAAQYGAAARHRARLRAARSGAPTRWATASIIEGNAAAALGAVYGGATVCAWYPLTPSSSLADAFTSYCAKLRHDKDTGKANYAIIQAEDEIASIGIVVGAGWNGARAFTATSGPGISLMQEFCGLAYFAEIPGGDLRRAARRAVDRHADPHPAGRLSELRLCLPRRHQARGAVARRTRARPSNSARRSFDLAERLQTPVFVLLDLEIGMNQHLTPPLEMGRHAHRYDRGKLMTAADLDAGKDFGRYLDVDGDGIPFRTLPGTHPTKGAYFTRGTSRDRYARYTEEGGGLRRQHAAPAAQVRDRERPGAAPDPAPQPTSRPNAASSITARPPPPWTRPSPCWKRAATASTCCACAPSRSTRTCRISSPSTISCSWSSRTATPSCASLIVNECGIDPVRLMPILHYDGTPITARFIARRDRGESRCDEGGAAAGGELRAIG